MSYYYNLDRFTKSYIEAALWSSDINEEGSDRDGDSFQLHYDGTDFSHETLKQIEEDCKKFRELAGDMISPDTCLLESGEWNYEDLAGHDFWMTRNGHGTGFWEDDRWSDDVKYKLTEIAESFSELYLWVDDEGQVWME